MDVEVFWIPNADFYFLKIYLRDKIKLFNFATT
jgi:hypothetical protein